MFSLSLSFTKGLHSVRNMLNNLGLFTMWILRFLGLYSDV